MMQMKIVNCPAVRYDMTFKLPFSSENVFQQPFTAAGRFAVYPIVSAHNRFHLSFSDTSAECIQISVIQIMLRYLCIKFMPQRFRPAMYCKMLCARGRFQMIRIFPLQPPDIRYAKLCGQIRIFPVRFMPASPSWVSEYINIR